MAKYKVVEIIDDGMKLVINAGAGAGIEPGQRYLVYALSDYEIMDPDTGKSLGFLELVRGTGKVTHVQESMSTIESDVYERAPETKIVRKRSQFSLSPTIEEETVSRIHVPFENPEVGDFVKRI